jgi:hypothetical protein
MINPSLTAKHPQDKRISENTQIYLDQQPTFSINSNTQLFKKNTVLLSEQQKSQSYRLQNLTSGYFQKANERNLKIDIDLSHSELPDNSLNDSCKTPGQFHYPHFKSVKNESSEQINKQTMRSKASHSPNENYRTNLSNQNSNKVFCHFKNMKEVETKYITLDPFADRKHSTRTDGDIRKFQTTFYNEDMRADFNTGINQSSSITPKMGFYRDREVLENRPRKVKIKTSKSSQRIRSRSGKRQKESNIVITKDEENNVYHIVSKESLERNSDSNRNNIVFQPKKISKDSKASSSGFKKKKQKIKKMLHENSSGEQIFKKVELSNKAFPKKIQRIRRKNKNNCDISLSSMIKKITQNEKEQRQRELQEFS